MLQYFQDGNGYVNGVQATPAAGRRDLGTIVHAGVQAYYEGTDPLTPILTARDGYLAETDMPDKKWLDVFKLAQTMMEGYVQWVEEEGVDIGERTLAVEKQLVVPIGKISGVDVTVTGKLDRLILDEITNEIIIEDTKTIAAFDDLRWLSMGDQLLTYNVLLRSTGEARANRGRHNQLRTVGRSAKAKPPFYSRIEFPYNDTHVENYWETMCGTIEDIIRCIQGIEADPAMHRRFAYPNPTKDCTWKCDFLPICPTMDDGGYWQSALESLYIPRPTE